MDFAVSIIDDEMSVFEEEKTYFQEFSNKKGMSFDLSYFSNPVEFLSNYPDKVDIIFLDIEMPQMNGIEVARKIREKDENVIIIFVTNMTQYAIEGYSVNAYDYVLKPIQKYSLFLKLEKLTSKLGKNIDTHVQIRSEGRIIVADAKTILYVESCGHHVIYHLEDKTLESYERMNDVAKKLPDSFIRCSRYYFVNLRHVKEVKGESVIVGKDDIKISRGEKKAFVERFLACLRGE